MYIVVNTSLVVELALGPELRNKVIGMVVVQEVLGCYTNDEETSPVGLETCPETLDV